jgi:hypothetical protein
MVIKYIVFMMMMMMMMMTTFVMFAVPGILTVFDNRFKTFLHSFVLCGSIFLFLKENKTKAHFKMFPKSF